MPTHALSAVPKGARITGDNRAELRSRVRELYDAGSSIRALAEATGRSYGFIHRLLCESDVAFRARGGALHRSVAS